MSFSTVYYEKRGDRVRARKLCQKSIALVLPAPPSESRKDRSPHLLNEKAILPWRGELWKNGLRNSRAGYEAYEQLAIYYEHRARDPNEAREIVRRVLDELRRASRIGAIAPSAYQEFKTRFEHRLARLDRKIRRPLLDALSEELRPGPVN